MNIENLQYFICLVETLNFTKAAQRCHIAQTAMSRYIAGLEKTLGVRLFDRDKRNVRITRAGKQFYEDAVRLQDQYRNMIFNVKHVEATDRQVLSIGFGLYEFSRLSQALSEFFQFHPEIQLKIHQYNYSDLVEKFKKKELDMMVGLEICRNFLPETELEMRYLFSSRNSLVMSGQKAERYAGVPVAEILEQELVITNCEDRGPSSIYMMQRTMENDFKAKVPAMIQTNSFEAQILMLQAGQGVGFIPDFIGESQLGGLVLRDLPESTSFDYYAFNRREDGAVLGQVKELLTREQDKDKQDKDKYDKDKQDGQNN